jgi:hypothetical protein
MKRSNYYRLLGVSLGIPQKEISRAHRHLARQVHPDRHPPERKQWAEERMKRLNLSPAVLMGDGFRGTGRTNSLQPTWPARVLTSAQYCSWAGQAAQLETVGPLIEH